jgi:hypothetical protein
MYTLKAVAQHNADFVDSFIDLKVEGWKTYEKAFNAYTYSFFKDNMTKATSLVEKTAENMKSANRKVVDYV